MRKTSKDEITFTSSDLAKRWSCNCDKVLAYINAGELRAINLAGPDAERPRYRVLESDLLAFEAGRASNGTVDQSKLRRRRVPKVREYV